MGRGKLGGEGSYFCGSRGMITYRSINYQQRFSLSGNKDGGVAGCSDTTHTGRVGRTQQLTGFGRKKEELKILWEIFLILSSNYCIMDTMLSA